MEAPNEATTTTAKPRSRRNRSKSFPGSKRCSLCFTPVVLDDEPTGSSLACIPTVSLPHRVSFVFNKEEKIKGTRRRLVRAIKAVMFETSLIRKAIKTKLRKSKSSTSSFFRRKFEKSPSEFSESRESLLDNELDARSATASNLSVFSRHQSSVKSAILSPCTSCLYEKSVAKSFRQCAVEEEGKGHFSTRVGLSLLLMSMLVLIVWGKICAIVWTLTWLYLTLRWWSTKVKASRSEKMVELPDICSDLYKKKVIMEGLLERYRCRGNRDS